MFAWVQKLASKCNVWTFLCVLLLALDAPLVSRLGIQNATLCDSSHSVEGAPHWSVRDPKFALVAPPPFLELPHAFGIQTTLYALVFYGIDGQLSASVTAIYLEGDRSL